jgi:phosphopantothenoylcysteine decarboxylase/phosphopantothenate--cysteine ligase
MRLSGKHILLGVTGGIAAYKSAILLRLLQKEGAQVRVAMTPSATRFIGVDTMAALSREQVALDWFPDKDDISNAWSRHIHWAEWADALLIAPCTANTLSDVVHGRADNPLGALVLAARCPIFLAPTMDGGMYRNKAVVRNLDVAKAYGYHILEPETGYLASGLVDTGRMMEPADIVEAIVAQQRGNGQGALAGKTVVVTAGPTREYIDAVRYISNPSSGKMGFAMAEAARDAGARVVLIHGPVSIPVPVGMQVLEVSSAADMMDAVKQHADADLVIMAAAVSDFRPKQRYDHKVAKDTADMHLEFERTDDILAWLGKHKKNHQTLVGFAMETDNLIEKAQSKRAKKHVDVILANSIAEAGAGFQVDTNVLHYIDEHQSEIFSGPKKDIAVSIMKRLETLVAQKS